jgi:hypothetical protein
MRRRKRNPFARAGILCLALVLGLGGMGVGLAHWTETLTVGGTVGTGEWGTCETGYAHGGIYAKNFEEYDINSWGWSNGPLPPGNYEWGIYAGAGGGEPADGTLVGTLTVDYNGTTAIVTYNMDAGFTMDATHLWVGTEPLPIKKNGDYTAAPGKYTEGHDLDDATTDSYTVTNLNGEIFVVAHTVVCGVFD